MPSIDEWRMTWKGLSVEKCDDQLYGEVIGRYADPRRSYHTVQHLDECFAKLEESRNLAERPHEVELALWFHDAVYDVRSRDNEERSAAWAEALTLQAGLSPTVAGRVHALIMVTKHDGTPGTMDEKLIVDIDLAILGAPAERFGEYERQVRQEYAGVPSWMFRRSRRKILAAFLARPHIFSTGYFQATYEAQARVNLERSIEALGLGLRSRRA